MEMPLCPVLFDSTSALLFCKGSPIVILVISSCIGRGTEVEVVDDSTLVKLSLFEEIGSISVDEDGSVSLEEKATSSCARISEAPEYFGEFSTEKKQTKFLMSKSANVKGLVVSTINIIKKICETK